MKAVIQTQFRENYGAHDWDGEGECPQYWKSKGGSTYIFDITIEQNMSREFWAIVEAAVTHRRNYSEEYIIGETVIDDIDFDVSEHVEEWESPIYLTIEGEKVSATQTRMADLMWRNGFVSSTETYTLKGGTEFEQDDFLLTYQMEDGRTLTYQEWVAEQKDAA